MDSWKSGWVRFIKVSWRGIGGFGFLSEVGSFQILSKPFFTNLIRVFLVVKISVAFDVGVLHMSEILMFVKG